MFCEATATCTRSVCLPGNKRGASTFVVSGLSPRNPSDAPQLATSLLLCQVGIAHYGVRGDSGGVPAG